MSDVVSILDKEVVPSHRRITLVKPASKVIRIVIAKGQKGDKGDPGSSTQVNGQNITQIINQIITNLFGGGIITITGAQMDSSNIYLNSSLATDLVVFYNGLNRYLIHGSEWEYVLNMDSNTVGIQILFGGPYSSDDTFLLFPNPQILP